MDDRFLFHIRERNCWPRISRLRYKCLLSQLDSLVGDQADTFHTTRIVIRLEAFERTLLQRTLDELHRESPQGVSTGPAGALLCGVNDIDATVAGILLFFYWSWADNVLRQALTELEAGWVTELYLGDYESAVGVFKKQLRTRIRGRNDLYDRRYYRAERLLTENAHLKGDRHLRVDRIAVTPHPDDADLWRAMGAWCLVNPEVMRAWPGMRNDVCDLLGDYEAGPSFKQPFLQAARSRVADLFEKTADFPPADFFEGAEIEMLDAVMGEQENGENGEEDDDENGEERGSVVDEKTDAVSPTRQQGGGRNVMQGLAEATAGNIMYAEDLWDVWSWCRMALISGHNRQHAHDVNRLIESPAFAKYWKVESETTPGRRAIVATRPLSDILSLRPSEIASQLFTEDPQEYMDVEFRKKTHAAPIGDPFNFVRIIPWARLAQLNWCDLGDELECGLGLDGQALNGSLCVLRSSTEHELRSHIMYLTDDMLPPHIEDGYRYPAYTSGGDIIFLRQKLDETLFLEQLRFFWEVWNDCAITIQPDTGNFYLLQTLPGLKARKLEDRAGIWSAFDFFDAKYRHRKSLLQQRDSLREVLGPKYDPSYSDFLVYIDSRELDLSKVGLNYIGRGSFGQVYRTRWNKKTVKVYDHVEERPGDVALKVALGQKARDSRADFFTELATTYSALAGDSSGCIPFFGF